MMLDKNIQREKLLPIEEHLQFLGFETEFTDSGEFLSLEAKSSGNGLPNIDIFYTGYTYVVSATFSCHEKKDMHLLYEAINDANYNTLLCKVVYLNEFNLITFRCFCNLYNTKDFGEFIQYFFFEVRETTKDLEIFLG